MFGHREIYKGCKSGHLRTIAKKTGVPLEDMLFLDNEYGNCETVAGIGVTEFAAVEFPGNPDEAVRILRGEIGPLVADLKRRMAEASEQLEFERAQAMKEQMVALQRVEAERLIVVIGLTA